MSIETLPALRPNRAPWNKGRIIGPLPTVEKSTAPRCGFPEPVTHAERSILCFRVSLMRDEADLRDLHGASPDRSVLGFHEYRFDPCQHTISHLELGACMLEVPGRG